MATEQLPHPPVFKATGLGQRVGDRWILSPTSFSVPEGSALAITGANGTGKTTLINLLLGKMRPSHGTLERHRRDQSIAAVTGQPPLYSRLTVREHFELVEMSWDGPEAMMLPYLEVLEVLRFSRLLSQYPFELSSGERQALALCLALVRPADAVVLDEPEQRLDIDRRTALAELLNSRKRKGTAVLFASHDRSVVESVADQQIVLSVREDAVVER